MSCKENRLKRYWALIAILATLIAIEAFRGNFYFLDFFLGGDDYAQLSLGHGINIDFWLRAGSELSDRDWKTVGRSISEFQVTHPGLPLQIVSAVVYQLTTIDISGDATGRAVAMLVDPSRFWLWSRIAANVITGISLILLYRWGLRRQGVELALLVALSYFSYLPAWNYSVKALGNETFALPGLLALAFSLDRAFAHPRQLRRWGWAGAASGACYLIRLNYVTWALAAFFVIASVIWLREGFRHGLQVILSYVLGAALSVLGMGLVLLGPKGLVLVARLHLGVIYHTGEYGAGDTGFLEISTVGRSLLAFFSQYPLFSLSSLMVLIVVQKAYFVRGDRMRAVLPQLLFLGAAGCFAFLAAMKHYGTHYLVATSVTVPFLVLFSFGNLEKSVRQLLVAIFLSLFFVNGVRYLMTAKAEYDSSKIFAGEIEHVRSLPLSPGELRIWQYKIKSVEYLAYFTVENSKIHALFRELQLKFPNDRGVFRWRLDAAEADSEWRYVVYPRDNFPEPDSISPAMRARSRPVYVGEKLIVVERIRSAMPPALDQRPQSDETR